MNGRLAARMKERFCKHLVLVQLLVVTHNHAFSVSVAQLGQKFGTPRSFGRNEPVSGRHSRGHLHQTDGEVLIFTRRYFELAAIKKFSVRPIQEQKGRQKRGRGGGGGRE